MRERLKELLEDVRMERKRAQERSDVHAVLIFRVLEDALNHALDSEVV